MTDSTVAERMRRYRARKKGVTIVTSHDTSHGTTRDTIQSFGPPIQSYTYSLGKVLTLAFYRAWVLFCDSDQFKRDFPTARFLPLYLHDWGTKDSSIPDFQLSFVRNGVVHVVVVECKNWLKDYRLNPGMFDFKIGKKFANWVRIADSLKMLPNNVAGALHPMGFLKGYDGRLLVNAIALGKENFELTKMLVLTEHVKFTKAAEQAYCLDQYTIERVPEIRIPRELHEKVSRTGSLDLRELKPLLDPVEDAILKILERVFY